MEETQIKKINSLYWRFIRDSYASLPDLKTINEEEFNECKTIFHVPFIGKFYSTFQTVTNLNKRNNDRNKNLKKSKTDV
mgnify:FL=1